MREREREGKKREGEGEHYRNQTAKRWNDTFLGLCPNKDLSYESDNTEAFIGGELKGDKLMGPTLSVLLLL